MKYYDLLGLKSNATIEEIKSQYRKLGLKFHPDKFKPGYVTPTGLKIQNEEMALAYFKEMVEAYDILSDPAKRAQYDRLEGKQNEEYAPENKFAEESSYNRGSFFEPQAVQPVGKAKLIVLVDDWLSPRKFIGDKVIREKSFAIENPQKISQLSLCELSNSNYLLMICAGGPGSYMYSSISDKKRNSLLRGSLLEAGFKQSTPGVKDFPDDESVYNHTFLLEGNERVIATALPKILNIIKKLEGPTILGKYEQELEKLFPPQINLKPK